MRHTVPPYKNPAFASRQQQCFCGSAVQVNTPDKEGQGSNLPASPVKAAAQQPISLGGSTPTGPGSAAGAAQS